VRIGERVKRARLAAGYSTVRAAGRLDISQQSLNNKESGRTQFTGRELAKLARIYKVPIQAFFGTHQVKRAGGDGAAGEAPAKADESGRVLA